MSSSPPCLSIGFFTLAQKQTDDAAVAAPVVDTVAKLKRVLTNEYSAMKQQLQQQDETTATATTTGAVSKLYKLQEPETSYAEVLHVFAKDTSVTSKDIVAALHSGSILIPRMTAANNETPSSLPLNWETRFLHQQLYDYFTHPHTTACQGCVKALRMMQMKSPQEEARYFESSDRAFQYWKLKGNEPLLVQDHYLMNTNNKKKQTKHEMSNDDEPQAALGCTAISLLELLDQFLTPTPIDHNNNNTPTKVEHDNDTTADDTSVWSVDSIVESVEEFITPVPETAETTGILLFTDVDNSTHHFQPNFSPTGKHEMIRNMILDDTTTYSFKPLKPLQKTTTTTGSIPSGVMIPTNTQGDTAKCDHWMQCRHSSEDQSNQSSSANSKASKKKNLRHKFTKLFQTNNKKTTS